MKKVLGIHSRPYQQGSTLYFHWYDAYSYTDWERDVMVFMPIPLNLIVAIGLRLRIWWMGMVYTQNNAINKIYHKALEIEYNRGVEQGLREAKFMGYNLWDTIDD